MLGLVVKRVPGIIIIGREHMPGPDKAGEVVMAIEVQIAVDLNEPGATAGTTGHIAGDGDNRATTMRRAFAQGILAGLSGLAIEGKPGGVTIGVVGLIGRLIIGPTGTADQVGQVTLTTGRDNSHAKVMMKVIWPGVYPVGRGLQNAGGPAAIRRTAVIVQRTEDQVLHPVTIPVETVAGSVNHTMVEACDGRTRAGHVSTSGVGKKDFPSGGGGISWVPIARGLLTLLGRPDHDGVGGPRSQLG